MDIYELLEPDYESDQQEKQWNPAQVSYTHYIPSIICKECGRWGENGHIRQYFSPKQLEKFKGIQFLDIENWNQKQKQWSTLLEVPIEKIRPGHDLGVPKIKLTSEPVGDFIHLFPGQFLINQKVLEKLQKFSPQGVEFFPITPILPKNLSALSLQLWEVVIHGSAQTKENVAGRSTFCKRCQRKIFSENDFDIDEKSWDYSDFFHLNQNLHRVFITAKIAEFLKKSTFTNYQCVKI